MRRGAGGRRSRTGPGSPGCAETRDGRDRRRAPPAPAPRSGTREGGEGARASCCRPSPDLTPRSAAGPRPGSGARRATPPSTPPARLPLAAHAEGKRRGGVGRRRRRSRPRPAHLQGEGGRLVTHVAADDVALDGEHPALALLLHGCTARPRRAEVAAPDSKERGGRSAEGVTRSPSPPVTHGHTHTRERTHTQTDGRAGGQAERAGPSGDRRGHLMAASTLTATQGGRGEGNRRGGGRGPSPAAPEGFPPPPGAPLSFFFLLLFPPRPHCRSRRRFRHAPQRPPSGGRRCCHRASSRRESGPGAPRACMANPCRRRARLSPLAGRVPPPLAHPSQREGCAPHGGTGAPCAEVLADTYRGAAPGSLAPRQHRAAGTTAHLVRAGCSQAAGPESFPKHCMGYTQPTHMDSPSPGPAPHTGRHGHLTRAAVVTSHRPPWSPHTGHRGRLTPAAVVASLLALACTTQRRLMPHRC